MRLALLGARALVPVFSDFLQGSLKDFRVMPGSSCVDLASAPSIAFFLDVSEVRSDVAPSSVVGCSGGVGLSTLLDSLDGYRGCSSPRKGCLISMFLWANT